MRLCVAKSALSRFASRPTAAAASLLAITLLVAGGCSSSASHQSASRGSPSSPPPLALSSEFSSGRVVASDGMGAAMVNPTGESGRSSVAGVEGQ